MRMAAGAKNASSIRRDFFTVLVAGAVAFITQAFKIIAAWRSQYGMAFIALERPGHRFTDNTILGKVDFMDQEVAVDH